MRKRMQPQAGTHTLKPVEVERWWNDGEKDDGGGGWKEKGKGMSGDNISKQ